MANLKYDKDHVASVFEAHKDVEELIITSDGNVFLPKHKSYALNHCNTFKHSHDVVSREEVEKCSKGCVHKSDKGISSYNDMKFDDIVLLAASVGIELKTRKNQGKAVLIAEFEALRNAACNPSIAENKVEDDEEYTPGESVVEPSKSDE